MTTLHPDSFPGRLDVLPGKRVLIYAVISGKRVNGALAVGEAEALNYEPGTGHVVQEVTYRMP